MISIQFPAYDFRTKNEETTDYIFDPIRKQWLVLTPEEWVRQNFLQVLQQQQNIPASLIAIEKELMLGELKKRFDILIYNKDHKPWMIVECKAPEVALNNKVIQQVLNYNQQLEVSFIVITNGTSTACFQLKPAVEMMDSLPIF